MKKFFALFTVLSLVFSILVSCDSEITNKKQDVTHEALESSSSENTEAETEEEKSPDSEQNTANKESLESDSESQETNIEDVDPEYALVSGTYFRSNESFSSYDGFTITLNTDGTFSYYETLFSSHIGMRKYTVEGNIITIVDNNILSYDPDKIFVAKTYIYKFEYRDGTLIFLASESDSFIYINLPDGAEFERASTTY